MFFLIHFDLEHVNAEYVAVWINSEKKQKIKWIGWKIIFGMYFFLIDAKITEYPDNKCTRLYIRLKNHRIFLNYVKFSLKELILFCTKF